MIPANEATLPNAIESLKALFAAIPKGKFGHIFAEATVVEVVLKQCLPLLGSIREYFLVSPALGGEASPFVKRIDGLLPREKPAQALATDQAGQAAGG